MANLTQEKSVRIFCGSHLKENGGVIRSNIQSTSAQKVPKSVNIDLLRVSKPLHMRGQGTEVVLFFNKKSQLSSWTDLNEDDAIAV